MKSTEVTPSPSQTKSYDLVSPLLLILVGVLLLLQNFDFLPWSLWRDLSKFWPILLISSGLQIAFARSFRGSLMAAGVSLGLFSLALLYALDNTSLHILGRLGAPSVKRTQSQDVSKNQYNLAELDNITFDFEVGAAQFEIKDTTSDNILDVSANLNRHQEINIEEEIDEATLRLSTSIDSGQWVQFDTSGRIMADIDTAAVPTDMSIRVGSGTARVSLAETNLEELAIEVGAGTAVIDLTEMATPSAQMNIDVGVGTVQLLLDEQAQYWVEHQVGVGNIEVNGERMTQGLGSQGSFGANESADLHLDVSIGAGRVEILTANLEAD